MPLDNHDKTRFNEKISKLEVAAMGHEKCIQTLEENSTETRKSISTIQALVTDIRICNERIETLVILQGKEQIRLSKENKEQQDNIVKNFSDHIKEAKTRNRAIIGIIVSILFAVSSFIYSYGKINSEVEHLKDIIPKIKISSK